MDVVREILEENDNQLTIDFLKKFFNTLKLKNNSIMYVNYPNITEEGKVEIISNIGGVTKLKHIAWCDKKTGNIITVTNGRVFSYSSDFISNFFYKKPKYF